MKSVIVCLFEYIKKMWKKMWKKNVKWFFSLTHMNICFCWHFNWHKLQETFLLFLQNLLWSVYQMYSLYQIHFYTESCVQRYVYVWRLLFLQTNKPSYTVSYSRRWEHLLEYRGDIFVRLVMNAKVMIVIIYGYGPFTKNIVS